MIRKHFIAAVSALAVVATAEAAMTTSASAAHFGFFFGVPGPYFYSPPPYYPPAYYPPAYYSPAPPPRSCWQWNAYYQNWVWACASSQPPYGYDYYHRRYRNY